MRVIKNLPGRVGLGIKDLWGPWICGFSLGNQYPCLRNVPELCHAGHPLEKKGKFLDPKPQPPNPEP